MALLPRSTRRRLLTGGLLAAAALAVPSTATAAAPANVTVEAVGNGGALLPQVPVTTTTRPVYKDADPSHACTGTSAAGALEVATDGQWAGTWFSGLGFGVDAIKGESHTFDTGRYWAFYLNGKAASTGVCGVELQNGDRVQLYPACAGASSGCFAGEPMQVTAPRTVAPNTPFTVAVTESSTTFGGPPDFASTTSVEPSSGASVNGTPTNAQGQAVLSLAKGGPFLLVASKGDRPPATQLICVTTGSDGLCGTSLPQPPAPCVTDGADGRCGTPDQTAGRGDITSVKEKQRFDRGEGPRIFEGEVDEEFGGIAKIELRITRTREKKSGGKSCTTFDAERERFVKLRRCGASRGEWFSIGDRTPWSYQMPERVGFGRYVLDVRVTDAAGNVDDELQRTRNRVVFTVER